MKTNQLTIALGNDPTTVGISLQVIKDAMATAIFQKIEATGIPDAQDQFFSVWHSIYLEADHQATVIAFHAARRQV